MSLPFRKEVAKRALVLSGIAFQASRYQILKAVVAALCHRRDVVQSGRKSGQLFLAVAAFIAVPLIHLDSVLPHVVKIYFSDGNFRLWLGRTSFRSVFATSFDLVWNKHLTCGLPFLAIEWRKAYQ